MPVWTAARIRLWTSRLPHRQLRLPANEEPSAPKMALTKVRFLARSQRPLMALLGPKSPAWAYADQRTSPESEMGGLQT